MSRWFGGCGNLDQFRISARPYAQCSTIGYAAHSAPRQISRFQRLSPAWLGRLRCRHWLGPKGRQRVGTSRGCLPRIRRTMERCPALAIRFA